MQTEACWPTSPPGPSQGRRGACRPPLPGGTGALNLSELDTDCKAHLRGWHVIASFCAKELKTHRKLSQYLRDPRLLLRITATLVIMEISSPWGIGLAWHSTSEFHSRLWLLTPACCSGGLWRAVGTAQVTGFLPLTWETFGLGS